MRLLAQLALTWFVLSVLAGFCWAFVMGGEPER
jgi:hypothetical protein